MWWAHPNSYAYHPYMLNYYQYSPFTAYSYQSIPPYQSINDIPQTQQIPIIAEKSYRETAQEIGQKPMKKLIACKRRRVQKSRVILKKDKEDNFERKKQKKDRNLPSNICRYFINYLYSHPSPQNIFTTETPSETKALIKTCIQHVQTHIKPTQTYIRPGIIEKMCRGDLLGSELACIFRMLFKRYMQFEFRMLISSFKKLTKKEKLTYFKLGRRFSINFTSAS